MEIIHQDSPMAQEIAKKATLINILLTGNEKSGKSTFLSRLTNKNYDLFLKDKILPTIGIDFKVIFLKVNDNYYKVRIWDMCGKGRYNAINKCYYKSGDIIIIFYDSLTSKNFDDIKKSVEDLKLLNDKKRLIGIVKNKYELDNDSYSKLGIIQNISEEEIIEFAEANKIIYGHISPILKYGSGLIEYLTKIIQEYVYIKL